MPVLPVPMIPQWSPTANKRRNDCGPACVAMCLSYAGKLNRLTVDTLALETSLAQSDTGLMPAALVTLAARHGLPMAAHSDVTLRAIQAQIDKRRPVIVLVAFRFILGRLDQADNVPGQDGHFMVVTGYDDTHVVMHDPDVWYPYVARGCDMSVPVAQLEPALAEYGGACVFMELERMPIGEQIAALISEAETALEEAKILAVQIGTPIPPPPPPVEKQTMTVVSTTGLSIRASASVNGAKLGGVRYGSTVEVSAAVTVDGTYQWVQLFSIDGAAYAATAFVCKQNSSEVYLAPKA